MPETLLRVKNLTKRYKTKTAVDHISFDVREGEIVGLLGPNGAGKTTTIQMLLGLLEPTEGVVEVFGSDLARNRTEILTQTNFVASYATLPGNLTPHEVLKVFSLLYDRKIDLAHIDALLHEFQISSLKNNRIGTLSSGEHIRLALAKGFINDPRLLLLDEPTASLDPAIARRMRERIRERVRKMRGAVVWTSHNMREVETMCDRVIFLSHGKIIADDTPVRIRERFNSADLEDIFVSLAESSDQHEQKEEMRAL